MGSGFETEICTLNLEPLVVLIGRWAGNVYRGPQDPESDASARATSFQRTLTKRLQTPSKPVASSARSDDATDTRQQPAASATAIIPRGNQRPGPAVVKLVIKSVVNTGIGFSPLPARSACPSRSLSSGHRARCRSRAFSLRSSGTAIMPKIFLRIASPFGIKVPPKGVHDCRQSSAARQKWRLTSWAAISGGYEGC